MKASDLIPCPKKCEDCMILTYLWCAARHRHRNAEYYEPWSLEMYP